MVDVKQDKTHQSPKVVRDGKTKLSERLFGKVGGKVRPQAKLIGRVGLHASRSMVFLE